MTSTEQRRLTQDHVCAECGRDLVLLYDSDTAEHVAACNKGHHGIKRRSDPVVARLEGMRGHEPDAVIDEELDAYRQQEMIRRTKKMEPKETTALTQVYRQLPAAGFDKAAALDCLALAWPKVPAPIRKQVAMLCVSYRVHPLARMIHVLPFKNKHGGIDHAICFGIDFYRLMAQRDGLIDYHDDSPRMMTEDEQIRYNGVIDKSKWHAICKGCDVKTKAGAHGVGFWPMNTAVYGADKGNSPQNMAKIRAEKNFLRKLRGAEIPAMNFEVIDGDYMEIDNAVEDPETGELALTSEANTDFDAIGSATEVVNTETGEIISETQPTENEGITGEPETVEAMVPETQEPAPRQPRNRKARPEQGVAKTDAEKLAESSPASSDGILLGSATLEISESLTRAMKLSAIAQYCNAQGARSLMAMAVFCGGASDTQSLKDLTEKQIDYGYDKMLYEQLERETNR